MLNKNELRNHFLKIRKNIKNKEHLSEKIINNLLNSSILNENLMIGCYASLPDEVNTWKLLDNTIFKLCFPRIQGEFMEFYEVQNKSDFIKGKFDIYEPKISCQLVHKEKIDIMLIPCIAIDKKGNRIGYGKGYYDRYLANYSGLKVALCFAKTIYNEIIPSDEYDIKMDLIIDENILHIISKF